MIWILKKKTRLREIFDCCKWPSIAPNRIEIVDWIYPEWKWDPKQIIYWWSSDVRVSTLVTVPNYDILNVFHIYIPFSDAYWLFDVFVCNFHSPAMLCLFASCWFRQLLKRLVWLRYKRHMVLIGCIFHRNKHWQTFSYVNYVSFVCGRF